MIPVFVISLRQNATARHQQHESSGVEILIY